MVQYPISRLYNWNQLTNSCSTQTTKTSLSCRRTRTSTLNRQTIRTKMMKIRTRSTQLHQNLQFLSKSQIWTGNLWLNPISTTSPTTHRMYRAQTLRTSAPLSLTRTKGVGAPLLETLGSEERTSLCSAQNKCSKRWHRRETQCIIFDNPMITSCTATSIRSQFCRGEILLWKRMMICNI